MHPPDDRQPADEWARELQEIRRALATVPFPTLEAANVFIQERVAGYNARPQNDLSGLSPAQLAAVLADDWESRGPLRLVTGLSLAELDGSIQLVNTRRLIEALVEAKAVRRTPKGNLPRAFVAVLLDRFRWPERYLEDVRAACKVINEEDVWPLHVTRVVLQLAGLVRRRGGALRVTPAARRLLAEERAGELFALLFRTYFRRLNLAYVTWLDEAPEIQQMVPYALWVVSQLDDQWWLPDELAERLLPPGVHRGVAQRRPKWDGYPLSPTYLAVRQLVEPFADFGLLETRPHEVEPPKVSLHHEFRKTPLCDRFLRFDFGAESPRARGLRFRVVR